MYLKTEVSRTEKDTEKCFHFSFFFEMDSYVLWLVLWMFTLASLLWMISPRFQYLAKMFLYMFCLLATGFVGVLASIPYGRTPNNQR